MEESEIDKEVQRLNRLQENLEKRREKQEKIRDEAENRIKAIQEKQVEITSLWLDAVFKYKEVEFHFGDNILFVKDNK